MNILIVTGKFGMGHWSASQSLRQQLLGAFPSATVTVEDFLDYALPEVSEAIYKGFALLVTHGSALFNAYYRSTENALPDACPPFEHYFLEKLGELLDCRAPDLVIATHPLCAQLVSRYKGETGKSIPLATCVTDLSAHSEWMNGGTDCYLVGSPEIRARLVEKGVEATRIFVTGIPVKAEFKRQLHRQGGGQRQLLIMGGGLGLLPKGDAFYQQLDALPGVSTTLIVGNNKKLYERLHGSYPHLTVLGFTDRVYDYMAQADLMLSKPGGITLFETIFSELPILAWEPFLQQEINNARFLVRAGIGQIAGKETEDCLAAIRRLLYDDVTLGNMARTMRRLKVQLAQESATRILAQLAGSRGARAV